MQGLIYLKPLQWCEHFRCLWVHYRDFKKQKQNKSYSALHAFQF